MTLREDLRREVLRWCETSGRTPDTLVDVLMTYVAAERERVLLRFDELAGRLFGQYDESDTDEGFGVVVGLDSAAADISDLVRELRSES